MLNIDQLDIIHTVEFQDKDVCWEESWWHYQSLITKIRDWDCMFNLI